MNNEAGQGIVDYVLILALALIIIVLGMLFIASLDENGNGILDSKEKEHSLSQFRKDWVLF